MSDDERCWGCSESNRCGSQCPDRLVQSCWPSPKNDDVCRLILGLSVVAGLTQEDTE